MQSKAKLKEKLKLIVHPYLFVLQEGKDIKENFLDYSLMILQIGRTEVLQSPPFLAKTAKKQEPKEELMPF